MLADIERFFRDVPRRELAFQAGEAVFHVGDPVSVIHLVRSGTIHLIRHQENGATLVLQRARANAVLAEASLYSDNYHCEARAVDDVRTWAVPRSRFLDRIAVDEEFARAWGTLLAHEVQRARLQAEILSMRTVAERLDAWLAWHGPMPLKGAWASLAAELGISPEALYREFAKRRR